MYKQTDFCLQYQHFRLTLFISRAAWLLLWNWQCLWWVFALESAQRNLKLTQFADRVLSKAIDFLCVSVTHLWLCVSCVENKRNILPEHWRSCGGMRECLCLFNIHTILWLQGHAQIDEWNCLLSILDEFRYNGAWETRWEVQLRSNFLYWTQQGDHKTERHRNIHGNIGFFVYTLR